MNNYDEFLNFVLGSKGGEQSVTVVEPLSISENGVYTASEGYAFSPVTVDVTSGGGGGYTVDDIAMKTISGVVSGSASQIFSSAFTNCLYITKVSFPTCTLISNNAFNNCTSLTGASFPACILIGSSAFFQCRSLTEVNFPACTSIGSSAFGGCVSLTKVSFPACTSIGSSAFYMCTSLTEVNFPACPTVMGSAFYGCVNLISFYLMGSRIPTLKTSYAFWSTPIGGYSVSAGQYGSIFVPASLYNNYLSSTNWSYFASRFVSV